MFLITHLLGNDAKDEHSEYDFANFKHDEYLVLSNKYRMKLKYYSLWKKC